MGQDDRKDRRARSVETHPHPHMGRLSVAKVAALPKPQQLCFPEIDKLTLQFTGKGRGLGRVTANVRRREEGGGRTLPDPKLTPKHQHSTPCEAAVRSDTQTNGADAQKQINMMMAN